MSEKKAALREVCTAGVPMQLLLLTLLLEVIHLGDVADVTEVSNCSTFCGGYTLQPWCAVSGGL